MLMHILHVHIQLFIVLAVRDLYRASALGVEWRVVKFVVKALTNTKN